MVEILHQLNHRVMVFSSPFLFSVVGISSFILFLLILTEILYCPSMSFLFALWKQMHFGRSSTEIGRQICRSQIILHLLNVVGSCIANYQWFCKSFPWRLWKYRGLPKFIRSAALKCTYLIVTGFGDFVYPFDTFLPQKIRY